MSWGLPIDPVNWGGRIVVCTGKDVCNKALVHTKATAMRLAEELDFEFPELPISIRVSGCPNGCGQHALADIGLQGAIMKDETGINERFDLWVGGGEPQNRRSVGGLFHAFLLINSRMLLA